MVVRSVLTAVGQQRPCDPGILVGQRHGGDVPVPTFGQTHEPSIRLILALANASSQYRLCSLNQEKPLVVVTAFADTQ
jgi:hypothetical protein